MCYHILAEGNILNLIDFLSWASHVTSMSLNYMISEVKIILLVQNQRNKDGCYPEVPSKSNFNQYLLSNYYVLNTNICFPNCQ